MSHCTDRPLPALKDRRDIKPAWWFPHIPAATDLWNSLKASCVPRSRSIAASTVAWGWPLAPASETQPQVNAIMHGQCCSPQAFVYTNNQTKPKAVQRKHLSWKDLYQFCSPMGNTWLLSAWTAVLTKQRTGWPHSLDHQYYKHQQMLKKIYITNMPEMGRHFSEVTLKLSHKNNPQDTRLPSYTTPMVTSKATSTFHWHHQAKLKLAKQQNNLTGQSLRMLV